MNQIERMLGLMKRATRLWRVDEAAFLCDCTRTTIYRAIKAGKIGQSGSRIPHSEVVRYMEGRDPFIEFQRSLETLNGKERLQETITHLERQIGQARQAA